MKERNCINFIRMFQEIDHAVTSEISVLLERNVKYLLTRSGS